MSSLEPTSQFTELTDWLTFCLMYTYTRRIHELKIVRLRRRAVESLAGKGAIVKNYMELSFYYYIILSLFLGSFLKHTYTYTLLLNYSMFAASLSFQ